MIKTHRQSGGFWLIGLLAGIVLTGSPTFSQDKKTATSWKATWLGILIIWENDTNMEPYWPHP